jgi:hypothetical protein
VPVRLVTGKIVRDQLFKIFVALLSARMSFPQELFRWCYNTKKFAFGGGFGDWVERS